MNYYGARQRKTDGTWAFTCMNDGAIWPIGYCRPYQDLPNHPITGGPRPADEVEKERATAHKHHDGGHATAEEARECYRQYMLDHELRLMRKDSSAQHKCKVCGEWTQFFGLFESWCGKRVD
jgi:hypothetical protein